MSEKALITAIEDLTGAIYSLRNEVDDLRKSVESNTAIQKDIFNDKPHDMMQTLNGSLHELIKELENRKL